MNCPDPLPIPHAKILRYKNHRARIKEFLASEMKWKDEALAPLRSAIRKSLRESQNQSCYYCRRLIRLERQNMGEAIEHYLDKSKPHYRRWAFHPLNLVIACQPCNFVKSTKDLGDKDVREATFLQPGNGEFRWLHPYFDSYSSNVKISPGPVYSAIKGAPKHRQAAQMITDLKLDSIASLDDRVQLTKDEVNKLMARAFRIARRGNRFGKRDRYESLITEIELRTERGMDELFGP